MEEFTKRIAAIIKAENNESAFIKGYLECAFFTEGGPDNEEFEDKGFYDLDPEALKDIERDCKKFLEDNKFPIANGIYTATTDLDYEHAGHDFWLTRNGHGAGFWDGDWPEKEGENLSKACDSFAPCNLYVGDSGIVYCI